MIAAYAKDERPSSSGPERNIIFFGSAAAAAAAAATAAAKAKASHRFFLRVKDKLNLSPLKRRLSFAFASFLKEGGKEKEDRKLSPRLLHHRWVVDVA